MLRDPQKGKGYRMKNRDIVQLVVIILAVSAIIPFVFYLTGISLEVVLGMWLFFSCFISLMLWSDPAYLTRGSDGDWDGTDGY